MSLTTLFSRLHRLGAVACRRPFGAYLVGHGLDGTGNWMKRTAVGWFVWETTQSPAWLGAVAFVSLAPTIVVGPVGGVLADRLRKTTLIAFSKAVGVAGLLAISAIAALNLGGPILVLGLVGLVACAGALAQASSKTIVSELVPRNDLTSAIPLNSVLHHLATVIGPALAGVLILSSGVWLALLVAAIFTAIHLAIVLKLPKRAHLDRSPNGLWADAVVGFRLAARDRGIVPLLLMHATFSSIVRPFLDMAPGMATVFFGRGVDAMALITSTVGIGAIFGGLWLAQRKSAEGLSTAIFISMTLLGLCIIGFVATPQLEAALPFAAVLGACSVIRAAGVQTLLQISTDESVRGRILGIYGLVLHGGGALGGLMIGFAAEILGLAVALAGTAVTALIVSTATTAMRHQEIARMER